MSGFLLKIIALTTMIIDHTGAVFSPLFDTTYLRLIGRVAFPIFVFFIAEGCHRTHDIWRYIARLGIFALISEIPFDLSIQTVLPAAWANHEFTSIFAYYCNDQNVFFTLCLGALACALYRQFSAGAAGTVLRFIPVAVVVLLGDLLHTDYGSVGVFFIWLLYVLPYGNGTDENGRIEMSFSGKIWRVLALVVMNLWLYLGAYIDFSQPINWGMFLAQPLYCEYTAAACVGALLVAFYNNARGRRLTWFFYAAYPVHLGILAVIKYLIVY
jgi:hypothetical protein